MIWATAIVAAVWGGVAAMAAAAPGECSLTGYDTFDCDVALDGGGLTFALPDGKIFAFTLISEGVGTAFLIARDAAPGQRPEELREFSAIEGEPGCWARGEEYRFCVMVQQSD